MQAPGDTARLELAAKLLDEVVYASRARQGAATQLAGGTASCGLGARAEFEQQFGTRAHELYAALWPAESTRPPLAALQPALASWVKRQDALDRDRNHFLKAFRHDHGFDRAAYPSDVLAAFESGLEAVNAKNRTARVEAAERLLGAGRD